jgi:hypothetical protein
VSVAHSGQADVLKGALPEAGRCVRGCVSVGGWSVRVGNCVLACSYVCVCVSVRVC